MAHKEKMRLLWIFVFAPLFVASLARGEEALLRLKFKEGDILSYKMTTIAIQEQMGMKIYNEQSQFVDMTVLEVEGELSTLEAKVTRITATMKSPMTGETSYDSDKDKDGTDPLKDQYGFLVGKKFKIKMDSRGYVKEVTGFDEIGNAMREKMDEMAKQDPNIARMKMMLERMFTNEFKRKAMEQDLPKLPEKPVAPGTEWEDESVFQIFPFGNFTLMRKNKLESMEEGILKTQIAGSLEKKEEEDAGAESGDDPMTAMVKMMKFKRGELKGYLEFDEKNGVIKKNQWKYTLKISMMDQEYPHTQEHIMEFIKKSRVEPSE